MFQTVFQGLMASAQRILWKKSLKAQFPFQPVGNLEQARAKQSSDEEMVTFNLSPADSSTSIDDLW